SPRDQPAYKLASRKCRFLHGGCELVEKPRSALAGRRSFDLILVDRGETNLIEKSAFVLAALFRLEGKLRFLPQFRRESCSIADRGIREIDRPRRRPVADARLRFLMRPSSGSRQGGRSDRSERQEQDRGALPRGFEEREGEQNDRQEE